MIIAQDTLSDSGLIKILDVDNAAKLLIMPDYSKSSVREIFHEICSLEEYICPAGFCGDIKSYETVVGIHILYRTSKLLEFVLKRARESLKNMRDRM